MEPGRFTRIAAAVLDEVAAGAEATLLLGELTGDARVCGRFQRAPGALRRLGGGRTLSAGQGTVALALALPPAGLFPAPIPPAKLINRYVRGLLRGLGLAGAAEGAYYFGRDFVTADKRQIAIVSQDGIAGASLFEAYLAVTRPLAGAPGPDQVTLADLWERPRRFGELADTLARAYAAAHDCELLPADPPAEAAAPVPPPLEDETGFRASGPIAVPIGIVEALVSARAVRLRGDFIAPSAAVFAAELALAGPDVNPTACLAAAFAHPEAALLGATPAQLAAAVLGARSA